MQSKSNPFMRESLLQEVVGDRVQCNTCQRRCLLVDGGTGWCLTRKNLGGKIYTLIYGAVSSLSANPIEKKPLYHFHPATVALTAGSFSCNFGCPWCQNYDITKVPPSGGRFITPEEFVDLAVHLGCQGTSISFNEPTLSLEWSVDVFRLAHHRGLYNTFVTNGYMTPEAFSLLIESGLDAMNVDIKGSKEAVRKYCKDVDVENVWNVCRLAKQRDVHLEITTLVIPSVNDDENTLRTISTRIASELGRETPWHVNAYYPAYKFTAPPTPLSTLERAYQIGKEAALDCVYIGNVSGHPAQNTYCPRCATLLIARSGLTVTAYNLQGSQCPACRFEIHIVTNPRRNDDRDA